MEIKDDRLLLFIELYKETFGIALSRKDGYEKASLLLQYVSLCIKPIAKVDNGDINKVPNVSDTQ